MNYLISIIPIAIYLLGIKAMDALSFTTWRRLSVFILYGMIACVVAYLSAHLTHWNTPLLEEVLKALLIIYLATPHDITSPKGKGREGASMAFFAEALVYGMAVGAGFSLVENILYVTYNPDITMMQCAVRGFGTALVHMGCTAICATVLIILSRIKGFSSILSVIIALSVATGIHYLYNLFLLPPFVQLLVTILVFCLIFFVLYGIEEKLITRWLDVSISDDVKLLGAIKEGTLDSTRSGQYLVKIRDNFHPEVFFDIVVYLELYLELSIKAKSRLMLREAEMDIPLSPEDHAENIERIQELSTLRHNIGFAGRTVLAPLLREKHVDHWIITELL